MTKIYFAHPEKTRGGDAERFIIIILLNRGYNVINPFDGQPPTTTLGPEVADRDFDLLNECDEVLCYLPEDISCIGSVCEMNWAMNLNKELTVITDEYHPFVDKFADNYYIGLQNFYDNIKYGGK